MQRLCLLRGLSLSLTMQDESCIAAHLGERAPRVPFVEEPLERQNSDAANLKPMANNGSDDNKDSKDNSFGKVITAPLHTEENAGVGLNVTSRTDVIQSLRTSSVPSDPVCDGASSPRGSTAEVAAIPVDEMALLEVQGGPRAGSALEAFMDSAPGLPICASYMRYGLDATVRYLPPHTITIAFVHDSRLYKKTIHNGGTEHTTCQYPVPVLGACA